MDTPFFENGLHFGCQRCSSCCRGGPGYVFLSKIDLRRLLERFSLDFPGFFARYCTLVNIGTGFSLSLSEKPNYDCIFWEGSGCTVYEDRPLQCSTYPFWSSLLDSRQAWKDGGQDCPGMDKGELRSREYIEERLWLRRANPTIILDADMARRPEDIDADTILGS